MPASEPLPGYTPTDIAAYTGVPYFTVWDAIAHGRLPARRSGGRWLITVALADAARLLGVRHRVGGAPRQPDTPHDAAATGGPPQHRECAVAAA